MSTASLLKAKQRRRKVVIYATKAGLKTARRRKRPSLVPAIWKSKRMMPSPPKRGGIIKSGVSCLTADVPLSRGSPRSHARMRSRSEEHTSELQSLRHLVCRLLLEKKKKTKKTKNKSHKDTT